jgi:hypothetical protein
MNLLNYKTVTGKWALYDFDGNTLSKLMYIVYSLYLLQKSVNVPVNAISPTSANHLQDKFSKLSRLISGQLVETGHGKIAASSHPEGIAFCKNLLAQKFVVSILVIVCTGWLSLFFTFSY